MKTSFKLTSPFQVTLYPLEYFNTKYENINEVIFLIVKFAEENFSEPVLVMPLWIEEFIDAYIKENKSAMPSEYLTMLHYAAERLTKKIRSVTSVVVI